MRYYWLLIFVIVGCNYHTLQEALQTKSHGWYFKVKPPNGDSPVNIGPYNSQFGCQDWQGSACYDHGPLCHDHPSDENCKITGNGFAYPSSFPYPVPSNKIITPCGACYICPGVDCPLDSRTITVSGGYYGLTYPSVGGVDLLGCKKFKLSMDLKGSRCFFVGNTNE